MAPASCGSSTLGCCALVHFMAARALALLHGGGMLALALEAARGHQGAREAHHPRGPPPPPQSRRGRPCSAVVEPPTRVGLRARAVQATGRGSRGGGGVAPRLASPRLVPRRGPPRRASSPTTTALRGRPPAPPHQHGPRHRHPIESARASPPAPRGGPLPAERARLTVGAARVGERNKREREIGEIKKR